MAAPPNDAEGPVVQTVARNSISDQPAKKDALGFGPYYRALAAYLVNKETKPPLTVSIEGSWGSGKSTFMSLLKQEIEETGKFKTIWFNAWRHDKDETLWAAFALNFIDSLVKEFSFAQRLKRNFTLTKSRFNIHTGLIPLMRFLLTIVLLIFAVFVIWHHWEAFIAAGTKSNLPQFLTASGGFAGIVILVYLNLRKIGELFGNPLTFQLGKYLTSPTYDEHISFLSNFHKDFEKVVNAYVSDDRVFVFIDDLDRSEVPKAAELMQALNLLIADSPKIVYVLGLDREKVAAGLAAKYEKVLPYLNYHSADIRNIGLNFGYNFLEKFIQIPFQVPQPSVTDIDKLLVAIGSKGITTDSSSGRMEEREQFARLWVELGTDSQAVQEVVKAVSGIFDFNPRRIKQFINVFRLRALLASQTGLFGVPQDKEEPALDLRLLGRFVALGLKWPLLLADLEDNPRLLQELMEGRNKPDVTKGSTTDFWTNDSQLMEFIGEGEPPLWRINVNKLIRISAVVRRPGTATNREETPESAQPQKQFRNDEERYSESSDQAPMPENKVGRSRPVRK